MSSISKDSLKMYHELKTIKIENQKLKDKLHLVKHENKVLKSDKENNIKKVVEKSSKFIYREANKENKLLKLRVKIVEDLNIRLKLKNNKLNNKVKSLNDIIKEKDDEIEELKRLNKKLQSRLNNDSTTSGIPTSMTPLNKKKVIPNSRKKSDKSIGGQLGHKKHKLEHFKDDEVTEIIEEELEQCPKCTSEELEVTGKTIIKDEYQYKIIVDKIRHKYIEYKCKCCGRIFTKEIPKNLKADNQYGDSIGATLLVLTNIGNVPINKTKRIIEGLTCNEISPSEGYISKLQKRASSNLKTFIESLKENITELNTIYWDDTVIMVNKKRNCMRFYGDDKLALYCAHDTKSKQGIDEDNILSKLLSEQKVVHDHNKVNYNNDYVFINVECCVHLERDLEKVSVNIPNREWSKELKKHFQKYNHLRKELINKKIDRFSDDLINEFFIEFDKLILQGIEENKKDSKPYYADKEKALLNRLLEYRDNYTYWVLDFDIPYTNNESERSLRGVKSKMKIAGQFQNINTASYYADIRSYIETCHRNGVNEFIALKRLSSLNPYTIEEILTHKKR